MSNTDKKRTSSRKKANFAVRVRQLYDDIDVFRKELDNLVDEREAETKPVENAITNENELIEWSNQWKENYSRKIKEFKEKNQSRKEKRMKKIEQKKESLSKLVEQRKQLEAEVASLKQQKSILKSQEREAKKGSREKSNSLKVQIEENQKQIDILREEVEKLKMHSDKQVEILANVENTRDQLRDGIKELEDTLHSQNATKNSLENSKIALQAEARITEESQTIDLESLLREARKQLEKVQKALKEQKNINRRSLSLAPIATSSLPEVSKANTKESNALSIKSKSATHISIKIPKEDSDKDSNASSDVEASGKTPPKPQVERVRSTKKLFKVLGVQSMADLKEESKQASYPEDNSGDLLFGDTHRSWIKGGTLSKLIDILLYPQFPNKEFSKIFLSTYYSFSDPITVTDKIFQRIQNDTIPAEELTLIKTRASEVIKMWLEDFRSDVEHNEVASIKLLEIIDLLGAAGADLKQLLFMKRSLTIVFEEDPPKPIPPKSAEFIDFSSKEVARQMTLIEYAIYNNIRPKECLGVAWNKVHKEIKAPNIYAMISRFNLVSSWIQTEIVKREKLRDRFVLIKKFLKIAKFCLEMNNFNGVIEILSGLNSSSVGRLAKTWAKIESEAKIESLYEELKEIANGEENYKNLRSRYSNVGDAPCVPYLGPFFSEFCLVEEGNPNYLNNRPDLINFEKKRRISFVIREMLRYQNNPYNFKVEPKTETFLKNLERETDENLYQLSITAEPKDERKMKRATVRAISFSAYSPPSSPPPTRKATIGTD